MLNPFFANKMLKNDFYYVKTDVANTVILKFNTAGTYSIIKNNKNNCHI